MRIRFALCVAVMCAFAASIVSAQDAVKTDPKHYSVVSENDQVRILKVHYGPHEKSHMHEHPQGVVVNLTDGHLRFTDQNGKVKEVFSKRGEARWFPAFRHTVENLTDESYSAVYIGVKGKTSDSAGRSAGTLLNDEQKARILAAITQ